MRRADHKSIGIILDSFHALAPAFPVTRDPIDPGRQDLPGAACRRAETRPRRAVLEPAFPLLPGPGRSAGGGLHGGGRARPAMPGPLSLEIFNDQFRCRLRGPHRDRRAALADPAGGSAGRRARPARLGGRLQPKAQSRGVGFIEFAVNEDQGQRPRRAVRPARLSQDRRASQQGRRALVAGRYRTRDQLRAGRFCPFALCHARPRRLRHRDRCRRCRQDHGAGGSAEGADLLPAGRAGRTRNSGDPRRRRQPAVFPGSRPARTGTPISSRCAAMPATDRLDRRRSHLAVDAL